MRARIRTALGLLALVAPCCTTVQHSAAAIGAAPLPFVAWLCADACRVEFPGADPLPYHAGAPATQLPDGSYEIRYEQRGDGRWAARAAGRIRIDANAGLPTTADYALATGLAGWRQVRASIIVSIAPSPEGPMVRTTANNIDGGAIARHCAAAVQFATALADRGTDAVALRSCCSQHSPFRAVALLAQAHRAASTNDLLAARDALRAARAVAPRRADICYQIGAVERDLGQDRLAAARLFVASRVAADPAARSAAAQSARSAHGRVGRNDADALRETAFAQLAAGRTEAAAALARAAAATAPEALADLRLRHELQRARDDRDGALGTALLLREYGAGPTVDRLLAEDLSATGHWPLARRAAARLLVGRLPASDMIAALQAASAELAQNAWIGWSEAVGAYATPGR